MQCTHAHIEIGIAQTYTLTPNRNPNPNAETGYNSYHNAGKGCGPGCFTVARDTNVRQKSIMGCVCICVYVCMCV